MMKNNKGAMDNLALQSIERYQDGFKRDADVLVVGNPLASETARLRSA